MNYALAPTKRIADELVERLRPGCTQIEIAGSIRRRSLWVHDIEIVAEPLIDYLPDLFGAPNIPVDRLHGALDDLQADAILRSYPGAKHGQRFQQYRVPSGIKVDLFIVRPPAQWGSILAIRTGPAHYSHWLVTPRAQGGALPNHLRQRDGGVYDGDMLVETPTEASFFALLGIAEVPPWERAKLWTQRRA